MAGSHRFSLWAAILIAAMTVPVPAARSAEVMTSVPANAVLAVMNLDRDQAVPDAACVARCTSEFNFYKNAADSALARGIYTSGMSGSNCTEEKGQPQCTMTWRTCDNACRPNDAACRAACNATFQNCCHDNKLARLAADRAQCVAQCPGTQAPTTTGTGGGTGQGATLNKKAEFEKMRNYATAMLEAMGPGLEQLDLEPFNNLRRMLAFAQVSATLAEHNGRFAMVSGGQGRIWIIGADGNQKLLDAKTAALLRKPAYSDAEAEANHAAAKAGLMASGLSETDVLDLFNNIAGYDIGALSDRKFSTGGFAPGEVWYFPKDGNWSKEATANKVVASSEHSSVRGTINGGGDFI